MLSFIWTYMKSSSPPPTGNAWNVTESNLTWNISQVQSKLLDLHFIVPSYDYRQSIFNLFPLGNAHLSSCTLHTLQSFHSSVYSVSPLFHFMEQRPSSMLLTLRVVVLIPWRPTIRNVAECYFYFVLHKPLDLNDAVSVTWPPASPYWVYNMKKPRKLPLYWNLTCHPYGGPFYGMTPLFSQNRTMNTLWLVRRSSYSQFRSWIPVPGRVYDSRVTWNCSKVIDINTSASRCLWRISRHDAGWYQWADDAMSLSTWQAAKWNLDELLLVFSVILSPWLPWQWVLH